MRSILVLFLLVSFNLFCTNSYSQSIQNPKYNKAIIEGRRLIDSLQKTQKIPSIDVAISVNSKTVWSEGFGFADVEHNVPVIPVRPVFVLPAFLNLSLQLP